MPSEIRWDQVPKENLSENRAVGVCQNFWQSLVDRAGRPPTVKNPTVGDLRSTARSTQITREHCTVLGRPRRSTDTHAQKNVVRRSTGTVDRFLSVLKNQNFQKPEILVFGLGLGFEVLYLEKLRVWAYVTTLTSLKHFYRNFFDKSLFFQINVFQNTLNYFPKICWL